MADGDSLIERHRVFGDYLRKSREKKGVTLSALSRHLGLSVPYMSDVEHGKRNPLAEAKLKEIAEYLEVPLSTLHFKAALSLGEFKLPIGSARADRVANKLSLLWSTLGAVELKQLETIFNIENAE